MRSFILSTAFVAGALAQSGAYGQCGGQSWSGATTCVSGYTCTYQSQYYSQCLPGTATTAKSTSKTTATSTVATSSKTATSTTSSSAAASATGFKWVGVDESGAEFGTATYPGTWGVDFIFPDNSSLQVYKNITSSPRHVEVD